MGMMALRNSSKAWLLTVWLIAPLAAVVLLSLIIAWRDPSKIGLVGPPVGAGAGATGGANAIGNLLVGKPANEGAWRTDQPPRAGNTAALVQPESLPQGFILVVEDKVKLATQASPIHIAGNFNGWNPGDKKYQLSAQSDMRWRIEFAQPEGWQDGKTGTALSFKFARGDWALEELQADMTPPGNRQLPRIDASKLKPGEKPIFEFSVAHWGDERPEFKAQNAFDPYAPLAVTGTVRRLQVTGGAGGAEAAVREVLVWLPPEYDSEKSAAVRYPVLYVQDGQNLFTQNKNIPQEWSLDETATALIGGAKAKPFVIVGIPHGGKARLSEYLPVNAIPKMARPAGEEYIRVLLTEIKPRVERAFRVETDPSKVGIGGSSLGAAIALAAAFDHPEAFGMVYAESLPLRTGDAEAWNSWMSGRLSAKGAKLPTKVYLAIGGAETGPEPTKATQNKGYVDACRELGSMLKGAGLPESSLMLVVDENAQHTEGAWASRAAAALIFLFR